MGLRWLSLMLVLMSCTGTGDAPPQQAPDVVETSVDVPTIIDDVPDVVVPPDEGPAPDDAVDAGDLAPAPDEGEPIDTPEPEDVPEPDDVPIEPDDVPPVDDGGPEEDVPPEDLGPTPECTAHAECADSDLCGRDLCVDGECVHLPVSCDDGEPCTNEACEEATGCAVTLEPGPGCSPWTTHFRADFDDLTLQGIDVVSLTPGGSADVTWQPDPSEVFQGAGALYFGAVGPYNYDNGGVARAQATLPEVTLPAALLSELVLHAWLDVETGAGWDELRVLVNNGDKTVLVWAKPANAPQQEWFRVQVDLTAFAGQTVTVTMEFDSVDPTINDTRGVFVDWVELRSVQTAKGCADDADCDDKVACSKDWCGEDGLCAYELLAACCATNAECDDSDTCTVDFCSGSTCSHSPVTLPGGAQCCNEHADCEDNNLCTVTFCEQGVCDLMVKAEPGCCTAAGQCDDDSACTIDACKSFVCQNVNTCCQADSECDDGDDVCTVDQCLGGDCVFTLKPIEGCCSPVIYDSPLNVEDDTIGWELSGSAPPCGWSLADSGQSLSAPGALYYGHPTNKSYACGDFGHQGTAQSPEFTVPTDFGTEVEFDIWMDVEAAGGFDEVWVEVVSGTQVTTVFDKTGLLPTLEWNHRVLSLAAWKGKTIQLRFRFDSIDGLFNDGEGVYVDNFKVTNDCGL